MSRASASPIELDRLLSLHESAFGRTGRESRLVRVLAEGHPSFRDDLHLALEDETGEPIAAALVLPRRMELRGARLMVGVLAPWGVAPTHQGRGHGKRLVELAAERSRELGLQALITIGDPGYLQALSFGSAFDLHNVHATTNRLPEPIADEEWRGLIGSDLPQLVELYDATRAGVSGAEHRDACVPDWEAHASESYALVHARGDRVLAYVRFRVREELEVSECAAATREGVDACLRLFARLAGEHARSSLLVHAAPSEPIALALARRGCVQDRNRFDGAAQLRALDWAALFEATAAWWQPRLGGSELGLGIAGRCLQLDGTGAHWTDSPPANFVDLPQNWVPGLFTGQRSARELWLAADEFDVLDVETRHLAEAVFVSAHAQWLYAPAYELADE